MTDVLQIYAQDRLPEIKTAHKAGGRLVRLGEWWQSYTLDQVNAGTCKQFVRDRGAGAARRELQDLQAAISYHRKAGLHKELVQVTLPPAGMARERWLTRDEVAKLLRICLHHRETQNGVLTHKRPLRHLARFILFAAYTGSRPGDCLSASFRVGSGGFVDTGRAVYHRRAAGQRETKKRQPTIPIPKRLLAHLRRWERAGRASAVEFEGAQVGSIKTAWRRLISLAGPEFADVVPYSLRHTAATWMLRNGVPVWEVAGYLGTSVQMIQSHYGHHSTRHLEGAAERVGAKR